MRALILMLFVLGIAAGAPSAKAGLSDTPRATQESADTTAASTDEATQQSEDQIGLNRTKRRDVQRRLARLGFDARPNGKFDEPTRDAIARWQEQHGRTRMWLSYVTKGYARNPNELEARRAVAETS